MQKAFKGIKPKCRSCGGLTQEPTECDSKIIISLACVLCVTKKCIRITIHLLACKMSLYLYALRVDFGTHNVCNNLRHITLKTVKSHT